MRTKNLFCALSLCLSLTACGSDDPEDASTGAKWQGASEHLSADGQVVDKAIEIDLSGADAADVEELFCERNYAGGVLEKVELKHVFSYEGQEAELELEFADFDYSKDPKNPISVGTASGAINATDINVHVKLETEDGVETEEDAVSGTFSLEELSGTADDDGIIPDGEGKFAGYLDVELASGSKLTISFTAKCGENDIGD